MLELSLLISFDVELWISLLSVANKLTWKLCKYCKICQRNCVNKKSSAIFHVHLFNKPIVCNDHVKSWSIYHPLFNSQVFNASFCAFLCERIRQRKYKMHKFTLYLSFLVNVADKKTLTLDKYFLLWISFLLFDCWDSVKIETLKIFKWMQKMTEHI